MNRAGKKGRPAAAQHQDTRVITAGRDPAVVYGFVNPPVYHASTVLYPSAEDFLAHRARYQYGRRGTPTTEALEIALARARRAAMRRRGAAAVRACRQFRRRCWRCVQGRRPHPCHRQRLRTDAGILRADTYPVRCHNDLSTIRWSAPRLARCFAPNTRAYLSSCPARSVSRCRTLPPSRRRACQRRARSDGQYLGDAALFPRARFRRRPRHPGRHQIYRRAFRRDAGHCLGQCSACRRPQTTCV